MVTIASPQTNDSEQKKRKQILERTKANHLSKQLQVRLQYAKLKVEHGWQRQTLNEVENLYFHHSQVRGLRPLGPARPVTLISMNSVPHTAPATEPSAMVVDATSQHAVNSEAPADHSQCASRSPVATKISPLQNQSTSISGAPTLPEKVPSAPSQESSTPTPTSVQSDYIPQQPQSLPVTALPHPPLDLSDTGTTQKFSQVHIETQSHPQPQSQSQKSQSQSQIPTPVQTQTQSQPQPQPYNPYMPVTRQSSQLQPNPFTPQPPPQYSFTQSYQASSVQNQSNPQITLLQPTSNSQSPFGNGSGPLTYDSFWSTHASAGSIYRSHAGFTASATPTGHLAMITPGGHAAVMTAEGVYVGATGYSGRANG